MSSTSEHRVTLVAKDGVSAAFTKVGQSARTAATSIDQAGKSATAGAGSFGAMAGRATELGAALGTVVGVASRLGAQAETQRRQINAIEVAYGSAASQVLKYTDALQNSTTFSNEDARQAALIAATLAQNYGLTTAEIEQLINASGRLRSRHHSASCCASRSGPRRLNRAVRESKVPCPIRTSHNGSDVCCCPD